MSLSFLVLTMAPTAQAEGNRSLGVTVSPLGAFALGPSFERASTGYAATVGWRFWRHSSIAAVGGHVSSGGLFTETTPLSLYLSLWPDSTLAPYVGLGLSLLLEHPSLAESPRLHHGAELSGGVRATLSERVYLTAEGRHQRFRHASPPVAALQLSSAYLGVGVRL